MKGRLGILAAGSMLVALASVCIHGQIATASKEKDATLPGQAIKEPVPAPPSAAAMPARARSEPYRYPILPGSDAWLKGHPDGPWALCEIPNDILTNLTDLALVDTCLRYPMRGDIYAFDSFLMGLEATRTRFNGLREMFARAETASALEHRFLEMDADLFGPHTFSLENMGSMEAGYMSALLLHPEVFSKLSYWERRRICRKALMLHAEVLEKHGPGAGQSPLIELALATLRSGVSIPTPTGDISLQSLFGGKPIWSKGNPSDLLRAAGQRLRDMGRK